MQLAWVSAVIGPDPLDQRRRLNRPSVCNQSHHGIVAASRDLIGVRQSPEWQSGLKQVGLLAFRGGAHAKGIARTCLRKDHPTLKKVQPTKPGLSDVASCMPTVTLRSTGSFLRASHGRRFISNISLTVGSTASRLDTGVGDVYVTHPSPLNPRALYTRALIAHTCTASESSKLGWNCKIPTDMCVEGDSRLAFHTLWLRVL